MWGRRQIARVPLILRMRGVMSAMKIRKRILSGRSIANFSSTHSDDQDVITVNFKRKDGSIISTKGKIGGNILRLAQRCDIELEGACEGVCACSTCHVIMENYLFDKLPEASEEEEDMLDQAFGLKATSRLGCQITLEKYMDNMLVTVPKATRNFYVDGHVPKPH